MEDVGTGQIQAGYAFVKVDSAFAGAINMAAGYHVLITPEGDSRGLYVGQRSAQGFSVRENMNGRSTLAFSYRIVAKPFGRSEPRLPMVAAPRFALPAASGPLLRRLKP